MDIAATTAAASATATSRTQLNANFETFLQLLTSQLRNQDPTSPLDPNQFTSQLVQYSEVEQQLRSNETLERLVATQIGLGSTLAIGYLDRTVSVVSPDAALPAEGEARWRYELGPGAATTALVIRDAGGREVARLAGETGQGRHTLAWDGELRNGERAGPGQYTLKVEAFDAEGVAVPTRITVPERVLSVEAGGDGVTLITASGRRSLADVVAVSGD